ncbi:16S rRNA (uracil(1498)-N(3))-methyltransferase [Corynebacterium tapiri]|uniref:Ribosomal RNA small subunit methyltransferase E n=1 Tax=Corynebacterium tapiri TaxID=1448266 RepID=A0A5C4U3G5_9CORY|nr:16S rRNA (uracil(1498)-N(3))-methyltransferase [Corynebacterium tapiri]TNL96592.1 16S rRNA (uracil(1498)-N(3))-methyltransferase [Corynebacterium tapiri]
MSLPVFIAEDLTGESVTLSGAEGKHAVTVMRLAVGERVRLIDAQGSWIEGAITDTPAKDEAIVSVEKRGQTPQPHPRVRIVQAIPKSERSELAVDLATQAGADEIVAWQAQRCVAKWVGPKAGKHVAKWESAARAAAKQSRRTRVPEISGPLTTAEVAQLIAGTPAYVLHESAEQRLTEVNLDAEVITLIVGPEGGIGEDELAQLGAQAVRLGPEVYRTASAAMVGLSAIGALTSRW